MFQLLRTGFSESGVLELTHPEKTPAQVVGGLDLRATELQANAATTAIMRTVVTSAIAPAHNICTELPKVSVRALRAAIIAPARGEVVLVSENQKEPKHYSAGCPFADKTHRVMPLKLVATLLSLSPLRQVLRNGLLG